MLGNHEGGIYFQIGLDTAKLKSDAFAAEKILKGLGDQATLEGGKLSAFQQGFNRAKIELDALAASAIKSGSGVQRFFAHLSQDIAHQREIVKSLEADFKVFNKQITNTAPGQVKQELIKERRALRQELDAEKGALAALEEASKRMSSGYSELNRQLRFLQAEMIRLEQAGERDTQQFRELEAEAARLKNSISGISKTVRGAANSGSAFKGLTEGLRAVSGAFAASTGVMALSTGGSENLQRIQVRLQSAIAMTMGLQELSSTLDKNSTFQTVTLTRAKTLYTAALTRLTAALGGSAVAAKALMGTLTLGLSVAVGAVISMWDRYSAKQEEASRKLQERLSLERNARETMIQARLEMENNIRSIETFTGTKEQEKQKIKELNKEYGETFGYFKTLSEWYDTLVGKGDAYIESLYLQAKAKALLTKAVEAENKVREIEETPAGNFTTLGDRVGKRFSAGPFKRLSTDQINKEAKAEARKEAETAAKAYREEWEDTMDRVNSIATLNDLGGHQEPSKGRSKGKKKDDPFIKGLEERKKKYAEYAAWVNSTDEEIRNSTGKEFEKILKDGNSFLEYLKKQRDALLAVDKRSPEQSKQLTQLRTYIVDVEGETEIGRYEKNLQELIKGEDDLIKKLTAVKKLREEINDADPLKAQKVEMLDKESGNLAAELITAEKSAMENTFKTYAGHLTEKLEFDSQYFANKARIQSKINSASNAEELAAYTQMLVNLNKKRDELAITPEEKEYNELLTSYQGFEEQRKAISEKYDKEIAQARAKNNADLEKKIAAKRDREIGKALMTELAGSDKWGKLFTDMDNMSRKQIQALLDEFEKNKDKLTVGLDSESLEKLKKQLKEAEKIVTKNNPFGQLAQAIKDYKEGNGDIEKVGESLGKAANTTGEIFDQVTSGLEQMGVVADKSTKDLLKAVSETVNGIGNAIQGYFSGNYGQMAGGIVQMVVGVVKLMDTQTRKAEKQIEDISVQLQRLETLYSRIQYRASNALGEDKYAEQIRLVKNLIQQREKLLELEREERNKKKPDRERLEELAAERDELQRQIFDIQRDIKESVLQTSVKSLAQELGDAIVNAFAKGEDAAEAWGEAADRVIQNAVKKAIVLKIIEKPLQKAVDNLYKNMGYNEDGTGEFDGITDSEAQEFRDSVGNIGKAAQAAIEATGDLFKTDPTRTGLSKGIAGLTQDQGNELNGRFTAIQGHTFVMMNSLAGIQKSFEDSKTFAAIQAKHLANIDTSTQVLPAMMNEMKTMRVAIEGIQERGVKML